MRTDARARASAPGILPRECALRHRVEPADQIEHANARGPHAAEERLGGREDHRPADTDVADRSGRLAASERVEELPEAPLGSGSEEETGVLGERAELPVLREAVDLRENVLERECVACDARPSRESRRRRKRGHPRDTWTGESSGAKPRPSFSIYRSMRGGGSFAEPEGLVLDVARLQFAGRGIAQVIGPHPLPFAEDDRIGVTGGLVRDHRSGNPPPSRPGAPARGKRRRFRARVRPRG